MVHVAEVVTPSLGRDRPDWVCFHYGEGGITRYVPHPLRMFHVHVFDLGIPRVRSSVASTSLGAGFEPTTERLTAARSTTELSKKERLLGYLRFVPRQVGLLGIERLA